MVEDVRFVRDKNVVAVIDFRQTTIYPTDASPGQRPERLAAIDPRGRFHQVHHRAGNPEGTYEDDGRRSPVNHGTRHRMTGRGRRQAIAARCSSQERPSAHAVAGATARSASRERG